MYQHMDAVSTNRGKMYLSGQHCTFGWDTMTVAEQMIAEQLGMDVIDVATRNLHGPESQNDYSPVPSFEACVEAGKKMMKWEYHKTGAKKLADGRMHGMAFRYQMNPRHQISGYTVTVYLRGGKIYLPTKGPCTGMFATDALAMVLAEETGAKWEDVVIEYDNRALLTPVGGGSDGTTSSAWVVKEAAVRAQEEDPGSGAHDRRRNDGTRPAPVPPRYESWRILISRIPPFSLSPILPGRCPFPRSRPPLTLNIQDSIAVSVNGKAPTSVWSTGMGRKLDTMNTQYVRSGGRHRNRGSRGLATLRGCRSWQDHAADLAGRPNPPSHDVHRRQPAQRRNRVGSEATGVQLSSNEWDYKKPTILDIAPTEMDLLETRAGNAAYGASGISHSMANTHIIICAIQNAIGKWIDPPATPDKVLRALGKA